MKTLPGVRIGVKQTVDEDLIEYAWMSSSASPSASTSMSATGFSAVTFVPLHVFHRQHPLADIALDRRGDDDAPNSGEVPFEEAEMVRLDLVVELVHQRLAELPIVGPNS